MSAASIHVSRHGIAPTTLRIESLRAGYGRRQVLNQLNLSFGTGTTLLLGPNGAGKSTLLNILAGVLKPRDGVIRLGDTALGTGGSMRRRYLSRIGFCPQQVASLRAMSCREQVSYHGWLKGMARRDAWEAAARALDRVGLAGSLSKRSSTLSGGQRHRLGIAQATVAPGLDVLVLDEPCAGLDPLERRRLRELLRSWTDAIVLVSTHDIGDLDIEPTSILLMADGQVKFHGQPGDFIADTCDTLPEARRFENAYADHLVNAA